MKVKLTELYYYIVLFYWFWLIYFTTSLVIALSSFTLLIDQGKQF